MYIVLYVFAAARMDGPKFAAAAMATRLDG